MHTPATLRARFPRYGYNDIVTAQYRLLTEGLGVNHLRLVMGTSMGGMHTWMWGERYPDFMDALMPLGSLPTQISGRNRIWRRVIIDAIRNDPEWNGGNYTSQPQSLRTAQLMLFLVGSNPILRQRMMPTLSQTERGYCRCSESSRYQKNARKAATSDSQRSVGAMVCRG